MRFEWHTHLCEFFGITKEEALELGTRSSGRKPSLPGKDKCKPVSNMTYEDIWASSKRDTVEDVFKFYRDQGSWSTFRQCVRHKDMEDFHILFFKLLHQGGAMKNDVHICEYGCGVAPFTTTLLKNIDMKEGTTLNLSLVDVDCNHLDFAEYRLNKIVKDLGFEKNINLKFHRVQPDKLPDFSDKKIDILFCFEVLEHVPNPVEVIKNIKDNMSEGAIYIENFIKHNHDDDDDDGPDLKSARDERDEYYEILDEYFNLIAPSVEEVIKDPNCTKLWQKK